MLYTTKRKFIIAISIRFYGVRKLLSRYCIPYIIVCTDIDATRERQSFDQQIVGEHSNKRHHDIYDRHVENYHRNWVFGLEIIHSHHKTAK